MKTLAERLIKARTDRGLTQTELAKRAGVSQSTIGNLESNTRKSAKKIAAIADALGVSALWLSDGKGVPTQTASTLAAHPAGSSGYSPQITDVIQLMQMLDAPSQKRAANAVQEIAQEYELQNNPITQLQAIISKISDQDLRSHLTIAIDSYLEVRANEISSAAESRKIS